MVCVLNLFPSQSQKKAQILPLLIILVLVISVHCDKDKQTTKIVYKSEALATITTEHSTQTSFSEQAAAKVQDKSLNSQTEEDENENENENIPVTQEQELDHQCEDDSDCGYLQVCNNEFQCHRKSLFPMTLSELLGSVAILIVVGIGQAAGIGGGLVVVPLLMTFFGYETKKSIALVFVTIFSASLGNLSSFMQQRYKDGGPLIDYKIVVLSLPTIMIGSVYGVALNKFLPQIVISVMLIFFILQSLTKTYRSYKREKVKETQENKEQNEKGSPLVEMKSKFANEQSNIQNNSSIQYPRPLLNKIACITAGFVIFSLIRGGSKFDSLLGIPPCGFIYQLVNIGAFYVSYLLVKAIVAGLVLENSIEERLIVNPSSDNVKLSAVDMQGFAKSAFLAGLIGSIVGLGGGMILVPKWLEQGIPSQKTTPCSISLLFLTALNSVIQFGLSGVFELEEIIYFSVIALLSSFIVSSTIQQYVKRTNQGSILILIIVIFMLIALGLFGTMTAKKAMTDLDSLFTFGQFC